MHKDVMSVNLLPFWSNATDLCWAAN